MKHKVAELEGPLLDAAVAKAEGWHEWDGDWHAAPTAEDEIGLLQGTVSTWSPSTSWAVGGEIIERERIVLIPFRDVLEFAEDGNTVDEAKSSPIIWAAMVREDGERGDGWYEVPLGVGEDCFGWNGPTPLIAAMRAYVASRFGEEVDL